MEKQFHTPQGITIRELTDSETDPALVVEYEKDQDFIAILPSWQDVDDAITALTAATNVKVFLRKQARIVYWLAKNQED